MTCPRRASDKDCRSRAENAKDHTKSQLLFARQPDLAATLTNVPSPLILLRKQRGEVAETSIFFRKRMPPQVAEIIPESFRGFFGNKKR
jgi:hypothetical protein